MDAENRSVFGLLTNLCEKILDESINCKGRSTSRNLWRKKLRTKAYSILLRPSSQEFSVSPHECFVKIISASFHNGMKQDNAVMEESDKCVEFLWQDSHKNTYIPSVVYFLAKLHNDIEMVDGIMKDKSGKKDQNLDILGFPLCSLAREYQVYHPSAFLLPDLQSSGARETKLNYLSNTKKLQGHSTIQSVASLQFQENTLKMDYSDKHAIRGHLSPFTSIFQDQEMGTHQMEDEGYVSPGATPLGTTPGEWSDPPWCNLDNLDCSSEKKTYHLTWEGLGECLHALEFPPLSEAGSEALNCNLKIREYLLFTLEPNISVLSKEAIHWKTLLHHVTYLLVGLESGSFFFNKSLNRFELVPGIWMNGISTEALAASISDFIDMGTCFSRLSAFVKEPQEIGYSDGIVQQTLRKDISHYLHLYHGACLLAMHCLLQRKSFSILSMRQKLKGLHQQILGLARAFGQWGSVAPIPNGVGALGHLYRHASGAQRKDVASLLFYVLHSASHAYFSVLERWVYEGEVVEKGDFFVVPRPEHLSCRNRRYWTRAFTFNASGVPEFLSGLETFLLRCGKSVHFLKLCDQKSTLLEEGCSDLAISNSCENLAQDKKEQECSESLAESKITTAGNVSLSSGSDSLIWNTQKDSKMLSQDIGGNDNSRNFEDSGYVEQLEDIPGKNESIEFSEKDKQSKTQSNVQKKMSEEEMFESEKKKLIEHYEKLSEASDKRRLKAEWRARRMQLRVIDSLPDDQNVEKCDIMEAVSDVNTTEDKSSLIRNELDVIPNEVISQTTEIVQDNADDSERISKKTIGHKHISNESQPSEDGRNKLDEKKDKLTPENQDEKLERKRIISSPDLKIKDTQYSLECQEIHEEKVEEHTKTLEIVNFKDEENQGDDSSVVCCKPFSKTPVKPKRLFPFIISSAISKKEISEVTNMKPPSEWPYRSVLVSLMVQAQKMDAALLNWILTEKGLVSHLHSVRSYFFLLDGEFGRRLSEDLFSLMRRAPGGKPSLDSLNVVALNSVLSHALASSTYAASDPNAAQLSITLRKNSVQTTGMDPLSCIQLLYEAPWPLNVVLTDEAVSKYSRVLDLLLRLKHASWALEDAFLRLRVIVPGKRSAKVFLKGRNTTHEAVQNSPQYHKLQLYRHQMIHLVRAVQTYITAGVLQASGKNLEEAISHSTCLDEFYAEHVLYVKRILFGCLLNRRSETIANILNDILRLIMKFHGSLCSRTWFIPADQASKESCHYEHPNFNVLCRIFSAFEDMTDFLLKYAWRLASRGYQANLFELLQMLNVNDFYRLDHEEAVVFSQTCPNEGQVT